ncbi:hypothetical protein VPH35_105782 [Triticum aestivum]
MFKESKSLSIFLGSRLNPLGIRAAARSLLRVCKPHKQDKRDILNGSAMNPHSETTVESSVLYICMKYNKNIVVNLLGISLLLPPNFCDERIVHVLRVNPRCLERLGGELVLVLPPAISNALTKVTLAAVGMDNSRQVCYKVNTS